MAQDKENLEEKIEPISTQDPNMSEKSKKLVEKINKLTEKIEQDKSPLKRHLMSFQVKMLLSKIQREIDLQNIKAEYNDRRDLLLARKERREDKSIEKIATLNNEIRALERDMRANEEYDVESEGFLYPEKYVRESGGIENLTERLKNSKNPEAQETARKIEQIAQKREKLEKLYEKLDNEKDNLEFSSDYYKRGKKRLDKEEKSLVLKQKFNVFSKIGDFFKNMSEEIKAYREEKRELKGMKETYKFEMNEIDDEYEKQMEELKERYKAEKEKMKEKQKEEMQNKQNELGKDKAVAFRERIGQEAKVEEPQTEAPSAPENGDRSNEGQQNSEPTQEDDEPEL